MASAGIYTVKFGPSSGSLVENDLWMSLSFSNTLDLGVDQAQIAFPNAAIAKSFVGQVVRIYRDGVAKWSGLCTSVDYTFSASSTDFATFTLNCLSGKIYLQKEIFTRNSGTIVQYGGVTYATNTTGAIPPAPYSSLARDVLTDILASQYQASLSSGTIGSPIPHINILAQSFDCLKFLTQVAQGTQWEVRFNPNDTVDFSAQVGSATSVFTFSEGLNIIKSDYSFDISSMINNVIVCGAGGAKAGGTTAQYVSTQLQAMASNPSSIATYGRWSSVVSFPNVTDPNLLTLYADALLNDLQQPVQKFTMEVVELVPGANFFIGDVVTVNNPTLGVSNSLFRIIKEQRSVDSTNGEQITLTLAQNFHMFTVTHFKVQTLEDVLNSFGNYSQTTTNTYTESPAALPPSTV